MREFAQLKRLLVLILYLEVSKINNSQTFETYEIANNSL